jgi:hypothetical protein
MNDYSGPFNPEFQLADLSRAALSSLGREYMIAGQLNDRAGLPAYGMRFGAIPMEKLAIAEWMGASPNYTPRMRRCLRFHGDDVPTIFKGLQLDVGFAHQFFDIAWEVENPRRGSFQLNSCGALLDVEPFGEKQVISTCHHMEDPTFDATAVATNPRARMRPVHRPPRVPADRTPHCHWIVEIDPSVEPVREIALTQRVRQSRLAQLEIARPDDREPGGWPDYDRPFDPGFQLEDLSHGALVGVCKEFAVQNHLLIRANLLTIGEQHDAQTAREVASAQWIGSGWVISERLRHAMAIAGDGIDAVLKVVQLHPAFQPHEYAALRCERIDDARGRIALGDCAALAEEVPAGWCMLLGNTPHPALDALVRGVNPRAHCVAVPVRAGERLAWEVVLDAGGGAAEEPSEVKITRVSGAARFQFARWRQLRA